MDSLADLNAAKWITTFTQSRAWERMFLSEIDPSTNFALESTDLLSPSDKLSSTRTS